MRILVVSNAPFVASAYGIQGKLLANSLMRCGHSVGIACNYGLAGAVIDSSPKMYPSSRTRSGDGLVWAAAQDFRAELIISLYDVWALEFPSDVRLAHIPWIPWVTIDSGPLDVRTQKLLQEKAARVVAYSQFGRSVLEAEGVACDYIPLGIQTEVFTPGDKRAARADLTHPATGEDLADKFIFGMVGRNNTAPSRKGFDVALLAFAEFRRRHPDSFLYIHTHASKQDSGLDLNRLVMELGLTNAVFFPDPAKERFGFPDEFMVNMYRSLDVLLEPSMAEGFGLPILEAAACGTPTIATRHSAMTELVKDSGGWLVNSSPMRMIQETWFARPSHSHLVEAMERAYQAKQSGELKSRGMAARRFAEKYDFVAEVAPLWNEVVNAS